MADVSVKMGVSGIAQFKQSMNQAQQSVKTLDAALKLNEKQLQATGDKETYMQQKSKLLQQQIAAQNRVIKEGQQALAAMEKQGVNPASQAYQKMQQQVLNAQTALLGMHGDLNEVGNSAQETAQKTDKLTDSLNGINKKVNFDAVLNGIGRITDGMEAAARKVASLARDVWDTMAMAASWADNENTLAAMYGLDVETLQRMQGASKTIDTSVEAIIKSRQKLKQNMASDSKEIAEAFAQLGVSVGYVAGKHGEIQTFRDWEDVFWDVGNALLNYNDEVERDVIAQKLFGRSWMDLMPLFQAGRDEYEKTLSEQNIVTEENVNKLNALDDALQKLDQDFTALKMTVLSELAPAFTELANGFSGLVGQFNEYIQTDEGKEKLEALSKAVTELFAGIEDVDFSAALNTAGGILDSITGALGWIKDNHTAVENAIKGIGIAFLTLKAAQVVGGLVQGAAALKQLLGGNAGAAAASGTGAAAAAPSAAGAGAGTSLLGKLASGGKSLLTWLGQVFPFALPAILTVDGFIRDLEQQQMGHAALEQMRSYYDSRFAGLQELPQDGKYGDLQQMYKRFAEATVDMPAAGRWLQELAENYQNWSAEYDPNVDPVFDNLSEATQDALSQALQNAIDGIDQDPLQIMELMNRVTEELDQALKDKEPEATLKPVLSPDAQSILQGQLNNMGLTVPVLPDLTSVDGSHANGLPFVPFDGYIAALHKGERVVPANQNKSYNATSNLFVESMYMNNGMDAQGLAAAMAAENRRIRAGFGS